MCAAVVSEEIFIKDDITTVAVFETLFRFKGSSENCSCDYPCFVVTEKFLEVV